MTLTVTPGDASADSYADLNTFATYCANFDKSLSNFTEEGMEASLRRGTIFVEGLGGSVGNLVTRWPGVRGSTTQRREWPRSGAARLDGTALVADAIPTDVVDATCAAAYFDLTNPNILHAQITPSEIVKSAGAGPAKVTFQDPKTTRDARAMLSEVEDYLAQILIPYTKGPRLYMKSIGGNVGVDE